jgi:hypothetical protein
MTISHDYEMTITFKLSTFDVPAHPELSKTLEQLFQDFEDGRYPFDVEMMQNGLYKCLKIATFAAMERDMQAKFGDETVETGPDTYEARWYREAKKANVDMMTPFFTDSPTVHIEKV